MATSAGVDPEIYVAAARQRASSEPFVVEKLYHASRIERVYTASEVVADFAAAITAVLVANMILLRDFPHAFAFRDITHVLAVGLSCGILFSFLMVHERAYPPSNSMLRVRETEIVLRVACKTCMAALAGLVLFKAVHFYESIALLAVMLPLLVLSEKQILYSAIRRAHSRGYGVRRAVIYGAGTTGRRIFSILSRSPKMGLAPVCFVDDDPKVSDKHVYAEGYSYRKGIGTVAGPITRDLIQELHAEMVIVAIPTFSRERFLEVAAEAAAAGARISFVPTHFAPSSYWVDFIDLDGMLLAAFVGAKTHGVYQASKRFLDLLVAGVLLLLLSPLWLAIAIAVRMTSPGGALFVHDRVGEQGRLFKMYKFRTMFIDSCAEAIKPQSPDDPRVTPFGRFLRRTSLDELPQLLNVLKGEMSLVGPRPEMPFLVKRYGHVHRQRLMVKPGITGLWQLSADRAVPIHENVEYDFYYIRNRTFFMDLAILFHTLLFAARGV